MDKKQEYILIGAALLVVVLIIVGIAINNNKKGSMLVSKIAEKATPQGYVANNPNALPTVQGGNREKVLMNIPTPGVNASSVPKDVAVPYNVIELGGGASRQFYIKGQNNQFVPSIIVVNVGDVVDIKFEAVDNAYNFSLPDFSLNVSAAAGKSALVEFQPTNYGQYQFFCSVCQGTVAGTLIVNKR